MNSLISPELVQAAVGAFFGAGGAYVAIKASLADLSARMAIVEKTTDHAHRRIDDVLRDGAA